FPIACIVSMGPRLHVVGRPMMTLPWAIAGHLPLLDKALPDRMMMYAFLVFAVAATLWLRAGGWSRWTLVAAGVAATLPNPAQGLWVSDVNVPRFFTSGAYREYLSPDDNILALPFSNLGYQMLWQVEAGMYFRMADGWTGATPAEVSAWPATYTLTT